MLTCQDVDVGVPGRRLVTGLNLDLAPGALVALLGPNGVGKTLTLHTLAGLRRPARGQVCLDGRPLGGLRRRAVARRLGLLLQDDSEAFPATTLATVLMGRHPHVPSLGPESAADVATARAALEATGLGELTDRPIATLSGGERRRLAVARLLAQDPACLLLDEPVNHLDPSHQIRLMQLLGARAAAGHAVLMSLHDPTLALRFARDALLLFGDGSWLLGPAVSVVTPGNLTRLFGTPYATFAGDEGRVYLPAADAAGLA